MMGNHNWCRQVYSGAAAGQPEQEDGRSAAVLSQLNQLADSPVWLVSAADHTIYSYGETTAAEVGERLGGLGAEPADLGEPDGAQGAASAYLYRRAWTILGGSTEVQKNILSKAVLGL